MTNIEIGIDASRALRARRTGTERYSLEIIRHLLALPMAAQYRWRLYVDVPLPNPDFFQLSHADTTAKQGDNGVTVDIVLLPQRRLWTHRALRAAIQADPPDLLFIPAHVLPFSATALLSLLWPSGRALGLQGHQTPPSTVVTIHDLGYHWFPAAHTWFQRLYLPLSTRWNASAASHIITPSRFTATDLSQRYGTEPTKISVIHEAQTTMEGHSAAYAPSTIDEVRDEIRERYRLPPSYALYVGTVQPRKNLRRLLLAYAKLVREQQISWHLVLAGAPGLQADELTGLAEELAIGEQLHFLGYVPEDLLPALYRGAHLFILPSLFEGFGLPVLEAQSYGVPVMTANNSSLPEIAGDAALLVDPTDVDAIADAMLRLSQDEDLRQQLIEAGHENVKRFSWEKAARETLAVFEKVLAQGQSKGQSQGKSKGSLPLS